MYGIRPWEAGKLADSAREKIERDLADPNGVAAGLLRGGVPEV